MKHLCECGKPAIGFARLRGKSGRATRAGRPLGRKGHEMCPACWQKWCDKWRMTPEEIEARSAMTAEDLDAIEAEQRKNLPKWWDDCRDEMVNMEYEGVREPAAVVRGRGMTEVLKTLRE